VDFGKTKLLKRSWKIRNYEGVLKLLLNQIINGLTIGSIYGLVAIGYGLIFSILRLINFAHGEVYMFGAFIAFTSLTILNKSLAFSILAVMFGTALLGYFMEKFTYRPLRGSPRITLLVSSLAVGMVLRNIAMFIWGTRTYGFRTPIPLTSFRIGDLKVTYMQLGILVLSFLLASIFQFVILKTKIGKAIRAVSLNYKIASALGINPDFVISSVFIFGGVLGGIAGILVSTYYGTVCFNMGAIAGNKAFIACVLGGMGSVYGSMLGGIIIGLSEALAIAYISPAYKDAIAFIILIIVLLFKPTGLFGKKELLK